MLHKKIVKHWLIYGLGSIIVNGSNFILIPLYTRYLTPSEYGILGSVMIMSSILVSFLGLGFAGTIGRFYFEFENNNKEWKLFFSTISKFLLFFGLLVTICLHLFGEPVLDRIFKSVRFDPYLKIGVWIGFLGIIPTIPLMLFQVEGQPLKYRGFTTLSFLILTCFVLMFVVYMKQGVIGALQAQLITGVIMGIIYLYYMNKEGSKEISAKYLSISLKFGLPLMFYTIAGLITEMSSRYSVERFTTLSDLGIFNLAQQYSSGLIMIISSLNMAWVPIFYEKAKNPESKPVFSKFGLYLVIFTAALGLLMSLFSYEIISLLAAKTYISAHKVIPIFILAYFFGNGLWILFINPICYAKKTEYLPWLTGFSGITCVLLNIIFVPSYGILGAAISLLVSYAALICFAFYISNKVFTIKYDFLKIFFTLFFSIIIFLVSIFCKSDKIIINVTFKFCLFIIYFLFLFAFRILSFEEIGRYFKEFRGTICW